MEKEYDIVVQFREWCEKGVTRPYSSNLKGLQKMLCDYFNSSSHDFDQCCLKCYAAFCRFISIKASAIARHSLEKLSLCNILSKSSSIGMEKASHRRSMKFSIAESTRFHRISSIRGSFRMVNNCPIVSYSLMRLSCAITI